MTVFRKAIVSFLMVSMGLVFADLKTAVAADRNRVKTTVKPLNLNRPPTTEEIMAAGQLGGTLYPTHDRSAGSARDAMNLSFGAAMEKWNRHEYRKASQLLKQHVKAFPQSPWVSEADLHLGCDAQYNGRYAEAQKHFEKILADNKDKSHPGAKNLIDKANLRLGVLKTFQNNLPEARKQFGELYKNAGDWRERTYAGHWIRRISKMSKNGKVALNCGNQALAALMEQNGRQQDALDILSNLPSSNKGQSILELEKDSARHGYPLVARSFSPANAEALTAPAIVHLPALNRGDSGHYWLYQGKSDDSLNFFDPQAGKYFVQTAAEFSEQWDGVALVKAETEQGASLNEELAASVYGGCCGVPRAEEDLGCPDGKCKQGPSMGGGSPNGAPVWSVNMVNMNFYLTDIPLWYKSPIGPAVEIQLSYNSQSAIALNEPFGNKWQLSYSSYLVLDTAGEVTVFMPDGRRDVFRPVAPANPSAGYLKPYRVFNTLTNLGPNLYELTLPEGEVYRYAIPAGTTSLQPFLVEIRDTHGLKLTFGYDANVRLSSITDAAGKVTTLAYNPSDLVATVTDPFGRHADFSYDADRNLTGITDMGGYATGFAYDANVNFTSITNGGGTWNVYIEPADGIDNSMVKYPAPGDIMWENYRVTVTNPQAGKEEYYYAGYYDNGWYKSPRFYGSEVKSLAYEYAKTSLKRGEISQVTTAEGGISNFGYDINGLLTFEQDGHHDNTTYTYNAVGRILSATLPTQAVTSASYAPNGVDVTGITKTYLTNPLGTLSLGYTATRDLATVTDRMGATSTVAYNSFGQPTTATDSLAKVTSFSYDVNHFLTQVNRDGQRIKSFTYDAVGRVSSYTDAAGVTLSYSYNNLNDVTRVGWPDGKSVTLVYSSAFPHLITSMTDRAGRTTSAVYDSLKRPIQLVNPEGGFTRFTYDKDGNLTVLTAPNGGVTRYFYDNDGRLTARVEADDSRTSYSYDLGGLISQVTNGRGATATISYDGNHNVTGITYSDGTPAVSYQYDGFDRLTGMTDSLGVHHYAYDPNDRLISIDGPWANDVITYAYDSEGRRTGVTVSGGLATTRAFDALHRLTSVTNASGAYTYSYPNNASNLIAGLTRPNGSKTSYLYDPLSRLSSVSNRNAANAVISGFDYSYGADDQRSGVTVTGGINSAFPADTQTGYLHDAANKLLSASGPVSYAYDADGNMTAGVTPDGRPFTAVYNAKNQLVSHQFTDAAAAVRKTEYHYNGFGFLEETDRFVNGVLSEQIRYLRDRSLIYQETSTVNGVSDYTWGKGFGGGIEGLLGMKRGAANYSYLYDGRGDVVSVLDSSQAAVSGYSYDPFGVLLQKTGSLNQPYRFSTKQYDEVTGLYDFGYRFFSPETGRWLTRDPLGIRMKEMNVYAFVKNNPLSYIDPLGLDGIWDWFKTKFKLVKDTKDKVDTVTEATQDVLEAKEAIDDPHPKSGFTLLKLGIKNTCGRIPGVGSAIKKIMTGAVETVETAPGGVDAAEREANEGTININAARLMRESALDAQR